MSHRKHLATFTLLALGFGLFPACSQGNRSWSPSDNGTAKTYTNPVIGQDGPDPTVLRDADGTFWLYNTADLLSIWHSDDLVTWQRAGSAFTEQSRAVPVLMASSNIFFRSKTISAPTLSREREA